VRGVSFDVRRGELFALLGTNGAGKTSTLEVLEGIARATTGNVRTFGHDPHDGRRLIRHRIGIMLQDGGFPSDLTVVETARMWAGTLSDPRPVDEAMELVDLRHRADVAVKQLSGGERRRLDLAVAILGRPELLFLDEPTAGLDPESRQRTWDLVRQLLHAGTTVVLTTHYLGEAEELADRIAIMHRGRIVSTGTPAEVVAAAPARVSFTLPVGVCEPVPSLPGALATRDGGDASVGRRVVVETADVQLTLAALLQWATAQGLVLEHLDARSASLEQVFLDIAADHHTDRAAEVLHPGAAA
jgi:ABC-2 type transport system ATP-binding protein